MSSNSPDIEEIKKLKVAKYKCLKSSLFFTRYFFKKRYAKKFIVNEHHRVIAEKLDAVLRGEITRLIINIAPRYGKTELAVKNFIANGFALNPSSKFIHLSYSDDLALDNSESAKDLVQDEAYQELFPEVRIKPSSKAKNKWYTTEGGGVLARSAAGQVTGFGAGEVEPEEEEEKELDEFLTDIEKKQGFAGAIIIDDPIKPDDADSEAVRNRVNNRYDSTIVNRVNSRKTPIIIIMQRLHEMDLCGHVLENYPGEFEVLSFPTIITEKGQDLTQGRPLWEHKHTLEELLKLRRVNEVNFDRQYMQDPQPREGLLYSTFRTYGQIPFSQRRKVKAYIDTADEGSDYLCAIAYVETETAIYVTDVYYTQDKMETTEPATAIMLSKNEVEFALVESNNGGKGFARQVENQLRLGKNFKTKVEWFHQSANKQVRIFTNSAKVNNLVYFPDQWETLWPAFARHVKNYRATGKNANDDAEDALTGMVEQFGQNMNNTNLNILSALR